VEKEIDLAREQGFIVRNQENQEEAEE